MLILGGDVVLEMVTCDEDEESIMRDEMFEERKKTKLVQRMGTISSRHRAVSREE